MSTSPQNRQLLVYYYQLKQQFDDFVGDLTVSNQSFNLLGVARGHEEALPRVRREHQVPRNLPITL